MVPSFIPAARIFDGLEFNACTAVPSRVNVRMVIRPIGNKFNGDKWETVLV
jgi:hypothetical protein